LLEGYDQEQWARERNYAAAHLNEVLTAYLDFRTRSIRELEGLSGQEWERPGRHSEMGAITILNYMIHIASHDAIHLAQIARQLGENS